MRERPSPPSKEPTALFSPPSDWIEADPSPGQTGRPRAVVSSWSNRHSPRQDRWARPAEARLSFASACPSPRASPTQAPRSRRHRRLGHADTDGTVTATQTARSRRHRRLGHGGTDGPVKAISESIPTAEARASGPLQAACGRLARARWAPEDAAFVPIAAATRGDGGRRPRYIQPQPAAITHYDTLRQALTVIAAAITAAPARGDDCRRQRQRPALTHTASAGISGGDEDKALFSRAGTMRDAARRRS